MAVDYFVPKMKYQLANGIVSGFLANKTINFTVRPWQAGSSPPPGNYVIYPPVKDPIYGLVALMTPADSSGSDSRVATKITFARTFQKIVGEPAFQKATYAQPKTGTDSSVFVLSSQPITGQNSLVVLSGFADLMDSLQAAGGATVAVG